MVVWKKKQNDVLKKMNKKAKNWLSNTCNAMANQPKCNLIFLILFDLNRSISYIKNIDFERDTQTSRENWRIY